MKKYFAWLLLLVLLVLAIGLAVLVRTVLEQSAPVEKIESRIPAAPPIARTPPAAPASPPAAPTTAPLPSPPAPPAASSAVRAPFSHKIKSLKKSAVQGLKVYAPDGRQYLINKEDEHGVAQMYVSDAAGGPNLTCITDAEVPGGPKAKRFKMQPHWHPSGQWIFMAVERDTYTTPPILGANKDFVEGQLQCGLWTNLWVVSADGAHWHRLTDFKSGVKGVPDGYVGPVLTSDGKKAVWSQIVDGNIFAYWPFGKWELILADVAIIDGKPQFRNLRDITPKGMPWNEPGNFHPDNESLLLTGSVEKDAQGMDQYILNIRTGQLTNLTRSPKVWDEHGCFSRNGEKIIFMSAYPYRANPDTSTVLSIKTDYMIMDKDGGNLTQLTHLMEPGYPEYSPKNGIAACVEWHPDGVSAQLMTLIFPNNEYWDVVFEGPGP